MAQIPEGEMEFEIIEKPMKWEYTSIQFNGNFNDLNRLGQDRWELVSVVFDISRHALLAYFKRPIWNPE